MAILLTVCEIFSYTELENRHFRPLDCDCRPLADEYPATLASLKSTFSGQRPINYFVADGSIFIYLASEICEITRNSKEIRT